MSEDGDPLADCPIPRFTALTPTKFGVMWKEGHNFRTWKKRLCAVEGQYLFYYANDEVDVPKGVIFLEGCSVQEEPQISKERKTYCFSVVAAQSWNIISRTLFTNRCYVFSVNTFAEMNEWLALLSSAATNKPRMSDLDVL